MNERSYWQRMNRKRMSRGAQDAAPRLALVGCGDDDDGQTAAQVQQQQQQAMQQQDQQPAASDAVAGRAASRSASGPVTGGCRVDQETRWRCCWAVGQRL